MTDYPMHRAQTFDELLAEAERDEVLDSWRTADEAPASRADRHLRSAGRWTAASGVLSVLAAALAVVVLLLVLTGCGAAVGADQRAQDACRSAARRVFTAVSADKMPLEQGQAEVDEACRGVDAVARKAILDAERTKALVDWAESTHRP